MNIVCWNVHGLGSPWTFRNIYNELASLNPHLCFPSETKSSSVVLNKLKVRLNYSGCFVVNRVGLSGGLCLLWKEEIDVCIQNYSIHHIDANIVWNDKQWRFIGMYGNPDSALRNQSWNLLRRLHDCTDSAWVIGGDMNEILWQNEKSGGPERDNRQILDFREVLDDCNLWDLGCTGGLFTWCNRRQSGNQVHLRLDRFIANSTFCDLFENYQVTNLDWAKSDHRPIQLSLNGRGQGNQRGARDRPFKFEEWWTRLEDCRNIIRRNGSWGNDRDEVKPLHHVLSQCASALKSWGLLGVRPKSHIG